MTNMFRLAHDDEVYVRGESRLRVPAGFRSALTKQGMGGATRFLGAVFVLRAKEPRSWSRWWNKDRRCGTCSKRAPKSAPSVLEFNVKVGLDTGPSLVSLHTPGFVCGCGARSYVLSDEVHELASDLLVCCDFGPSGVQPNNDDQRARRRAEVRRIQ